MLSTRPRGFPSYYLKGVVSFDEGNSFAFPAIRSRGVSQNKIVSPILLGATLSLL